ncbi:MAG: hypothetical protein LBE33_05740 [Zoogloeaceae bacterium]|nr:hypothetical protein [Zoogloeaceae bacterium]
MAAASRAGETRANKAAASNMAGKNDVRRVLALSLMGIRITFMCSPVRISLKRVRDCKLLIAANKCAAIPARRFFLQTIRRFFFRLGQGMTSVPDKDRLR